MGIKIALAGNPNSGKTTLFNALTGSNQFVGNWPGVTVEKKEGKLKKYPDVTVTDLPGIYSLSPYTLEEVVARNYLVNEEPDVILNIVDGTNLERNLYLTTQLTELGIPVVIAINMMDAVEKNGEKINLTELSRAFGCPAVEVSAIKNIGVIEAAEAAMKAAESGKTIPMHNFSGTVEHAIAHIEEAALHDLPEEKQRWYAIKIFERDKKVIESLGISDERIAHIENDIVRAETALDDDAESIITNERYLYISSVIKGCYKKRRTGGISVSDKIDRVVTNRWAALPIFALVMFLVYFISVTTIGTWVTDFTNDGLFGDGFHLFGIGSSSYSENAEKYADAEAVLNGFILHEEEKGTDLSALNSALDKESDSYSVEVALLALNAFASKYSDDYEISYTVTVDEETLKDGSVTSTGADLKSAIVTLSKFSLEEPSPDAYGVWVVGIPPLVEKGLTAVNCSAWLKGLLLNGVVAGVGAVLGFVPQILVLFLILAFLEACGYMSRIAFVLDKIFRKFGLSGKSFIPLLIGTGCSVPGIMASRTIENERDRRMTITTTSFIPCGAKLPFIGLMAGAIFGGAWWVAPSAYFIGIIAVVVSGIILKKTKLFLGDPAPFVMELPPYHLPTLSNILRSMWDRGWSFIKKAGTVILLSTMIIWFTTYFGFVDGNFRMLTDNEVNYSILAKIGGAIAFFFKPLGFGTWQASVASITGLVAKENIVSTLSVVFSGSGGVYATLANEFTAFSGYSFLLFNLLCAPCFAAIGAIRREMNSFKWTLFAIGYQTVFAYSISLIVYQLGLAFTGSMNIIGTVAASVMIALYIYLLLRSPSKCKKATA